MIQGETEMIRIMLNTLFMARTMNGASKDVGAITYAADKDLREIKANVKGNRPGDKGVTAEDWKLIYIGVLRRSIEHVESK